MFYQGLITGLQRSRQCLAPISLFLSSTVHASFIESTMGAAVVNDATAAYYNPAALTLLKNSQIIALGSVASSRTRFSGQATQLSTGYTQSGTSSGQGNYYLPAAYLGIPMNEKVTGGFALVANDFNKSVEDHAILRYVQSSNTIQDIDIIPAIGFKINDFISVGAGLNFSQARFLLQPVTGIGSLNIPDSQSTNDSSANGFGGDAGILLRPAKATLLGFNYRSAVTYRLRGISILNDNPAIRSNNYHFTYWTPARNVLSMSHHVTQKFGFIGTIQYIQWSIFKDVDIYNIATRAGFQPIVLSSARSHYNFHNAWVLTAGGNYRFSPAWIIRIAGSYNQSPADGNFQIDNGDSMILGGSMGYQLFKNIILDFSYAHAFINNKNISIKTTNNIINGINTGTLNSFSIKMTCNI